MCYSPPPRGIDGRVDGIFTVAVLGNLATSDDVAEKYCRLVRCEFAKHLDELIWTCFRLEELAGNKAGSEDCLAADRVRTGEKRIYEIGRAFNWDGIIFQ